MPGNVWSLALAASGPIALSELASSRPSEAARATPWRRAIFISFKPGNDRTAWSWAGVGKAAVGVPARSNTVPWATDRRRRTPASLLADLLADSTAHAAASYGE